MKNTAIFAIFIILFFAACNEENTFQTNGSCWTAVTNSSFGSSAVNCVVWGDGIFIAGGDNGKMAYSTDGINWTAAESSFGNNTIRCAAWGNGQFMAGGDNGSMAYSADGINWTPVADSSFNSLAVHGLAWGNGKWVAAGRSWMAYSGENGTSWTGTPSNDLFKYLQGPPTLNAVAYNGSRFVMAGAIGGQGHGGSLASSIDGINWTVHSIEELTGTAVNGVAFGGGKWAAVTLDAILYSSGGTAWNAVESERQLYDIAWGYNKFIAVGVSDTIIYSADGTTWTAYKDVSLNSHFRAITCGDGTWVTAGLNGAIAYFFEPKD